MAAPDCMLSTNFSAADLLQAGETWAETRVKNTPLRAATWKGLSQVCEQILEPVLATFGRPTITYGFASEALTKRIGGRIYPKGDQHAGCECNSKGNRIWERGGQALDFCVPNLSSAVLAHWVVTNLPFDRLYFYKIDRPIHVSLGPDNSRRIEAMMPNALGRLTPRKIEPQWLADLCPK
jgi:Peptidase M15